MEGSGYEPRLPVFGPWSRHLSAAFAQVPHNFTLSADKSDEETRRCFCVQTAPALYSCRTISKSHSRAAKRSAVVPSSSSSTPVTTPSVILAPASRSTRTKTPCPCGQRDQYNVAKKQKRQLEKSARHSSRIPIFSTQLPEVYI